MKPENRKSAKSFIKAELHEMSQEVQDLLNEPEDIDHEYWAGDPDHDCMEDNRYDDWVYGTYDDDYVFDDWDPEDWSPTYTPRPQPVEVEGTPLGELLRSISHV